MGHLCKFSKTRLAYYNNNPIDIIWNDIPTDVTVNTPSANDVTNGYLVCRIKNDKIRYHQVIWNSMGLYIKENELAGLMYNFKKISIKKIKVTVGSVIPMAKAISGTAFTTSFNNCTYSWVYVLKDTENVMADSVFATQDQYNEFVRTYDGRGYTGKKRVDLPQPDILYKIPYYENSFTTAPADADCFSSTLFGKPGVTLPTTPISADSTAIGMSLGEMKQQYFPTFLMDNENLYQLYPGENVFQLEYESKGRLSDWYFEGGQHNEAIIDQDCRAETQINTNNVMNAMFSLRNRCFPRIRNPDAAGNQNEDAINLGDDNVYRNDGDFTDQGPPQIFIKGVPIQDPDGNLIEHTFCATITWEIEIEGVENDLFIPRPLQHGWCLRKVINQYTSATAMEKRILYDNTYPHKLQPQGFKSKARAHKKIVARSATSDFPGIFAQISNEVNNISFQYNHRRNNIIRPCDLFTKVTPPTVNGKIPLSNAEPVSESEASSSFIEQKYTRKAPTTSDSKQ